MITVIGLPLPFIVFWPFYDTLFNDGYPRNRMKGIICSMHRFDLSVTETQLTLSSKPKLIIGAIGTY